MSMAIYSRNLYVPVITSQNETLTNWQILIVNPFVSSSLEYFSFRLYGSIIPEIKETMLKCIVSSLPAIRLVHLYASEGKPTDEWWWVKEARDGTDMNFEKVCEDDAKRLSNEKATSRLWVY
jgi:hypothetical protein